MGGSLGEAHVEVRRTGRLKAAARAVAGGGSISLAMFDSFSVRTFVNGLLGGGRIGTIFAFSGQMAQFVPEGARQRFIMDFVRSEEHTSELVTNAHLVCRLLLEKKKNKQDMLI